MAKKLCVDCKHYRDAMANPYIAFPAACAHEQNKSVVDGASRESPEYLRYVGQCGVSGEWWEPK